MRVVEKLVGGYRRMLLPARCGQGSYRPRSVIVACGDGDLQLRRLRWWHWNRRTAIGRGTALVNDCIPYCASGHFHAYRVRSAPAGCAPAPAIEVCATRACASPTGVARRADPVPTPCLSCACSYATFRWPSALHPLGPPVRTPDDALGESRASTGCDDRRGHPERGEECFEEATDYLRGRIGGQTVRCRYQEERTDRYDRQLLDLFKDSELVNLDIAQEGVG